MKLKVNAVLDEKFMPMSLMLRKFQENAKAAGGKEITLTAGEHTIKI